MLNASQTKLLQIGALLLVLPLMVLVSSYPKWGAHQHAPETTEAKKEKNPTTGIAIPVSEAEQKNTDEKSADTENKYCPTPFTEPCLWASCMFRRTITNTESLFLFLAALFTFVIAGFTIGLYLDGREKGRRELRAYVFGKAFNQNFVHDKAHILEYLISVTWENYGLTPATDVRSSIEWQPYPMIENREPTPIHPQHKGPFSIVGPRLAGKSDDVFIPINIIMENWQNQTEIFVLARVEYRDIFEPHITRHHKQCARITILNDPRIPPPKDQGHIVFNTYGAENSFR